MIQQTLTINTNILSKYVKIRNWKICRKISTINSCMIFTWHLIILAEWSISVHPKNVKKSLFSGGIEMEHWTKMDLKLDWNLTRQAPMDNIHLVSTQNFLKYSHFLLPDACVSCWFFDFSKNLACTLNGWSYTEFISSSLILDFIYWVSCKIMD